MKVWLYVEGGGDDPQLLRQCRNSFGKFLEKNDLKGKMPKIVACGSRQHAYRDFKNALKAADSHQKYLLLLVDSEESIAPKNGITPNSSGKPWQHLAEREGDKWDKPSGVTDVQCHLMVETMETWLLADRNTLQDYFGKHFNANALPAISRNVESIPKQELENTLNRSASLTAKKGYKKGRDSFALLEKINPTVVRQQCPWADRFLTELQDKCQ